MASSVHAGIGAIVYNDGTTFRVWAPFADAVAVMGDFNDWSQTANVLAREDGGYFAADVPGAVAGHEYKFVIKHGDHTLLRNDPRALQLTPSGDNSVIVDPSFSWGDDHFTLPAPGDLILYELHVGTFHRPDPSLPGTFAAAAQKLDHLVRLGVNAIEVMPCTVAKNDRWWGYTPGYIYAVATEYGGVRAFKEFVRAAHAHGIAVILDVVYNHLASDPDLDVWRFDGWYEGDKGGIYFYNDWRASTPWGETRFDYGRPEVRQYLTDNAAMWLRDYHVDGLRVDATLFIRNAAGKNNDPAHDLADGWKLLQEINQTAHKINPGALVIAEDLQGNEWLTKPIDEGGAGFSTQWDPSFAGSLRDALDPPTDDARNVSSVQFVLKNILDGDAFKRVVYSESHDADANGHARLPEEIAPGHADDSLYARKRANLAAALMFAAPGVPMMFQGQELLEGGSFTHWQPLDWSRTQTYHGVLALYTDLIRLRRSLNGLKGQHINVLLADQTAKTLAFHRFDQGGVHHDAVIAANLSYQPQTIALQWPQPGTWKARFNSDWQGYSSDFTNSPTPDIQAPQTGAASITVAPYSVVIYSQD